MSREVSLPRHLALAKNVRGVCVFDPAEPPEQEFFTWLSRKHQYRKVGFPSLIYDAPAVDLDSYKTFTPLTLPNEALTDLQSACTENHADWIVESLLVASAYVIPLFIDHHAADQFEPFCRWRAETSDDLPEDQVLRHMRIIGYGMLDLFETSTEDGLRAIRDSAIQEEIEHRNGIAREDGKDRFWRLLESQEDSMNWVGGYFDILPAIPTTVKTLDDEASIGLGLVGGFLVNPPYHE